MELKGSKTEKNLMTAFAGESQARNKYTYFASVAKKEGYEQIAAIFLKTADNEKEHAKMWFKALGELGDTKRRTLRRRPRARITNGRTCTRSLPARRRKRASRRWRRDSAWSAEIEKHHEERYRALLKNLEMQQVFEKGEMTMWECRNCGHLVMGKKAPEVCPVCAHPQSYFEVRAENY